MLSFSCPDRFINSLIHLAQIKLCSYKPLIVILISGWRRTVFYLISKLIILSHKFSCCFSPRLISIKAEPDGSNLRMFPKKSLKWGICKHPKCQLIRFIICENIHITHKVDCSLKYYKLCTVFIYHIKSIVLIIACDITLEWLALLIKHSSHTCKSCHSIFIISSENNIVVMPALINQSIF